MSIIKKLSLTFLASLSLLLVTSFKASAAVVISPENPNTAGVIVKEPINDTLFVFGDNVTIDAPINGDLYIGAQNATINAPISGNVYGAGVDITLNSSVGKDYFGLFQRVNFTRLASVNLNVYLSAEETINVTNNPAIKGEVRMTQFEIKQESAFGALKGVVLIKILSLLLIGLILSSLLPKTFDTFQETGTKHWGMSTLMGVAGVLIIPLAIFLLFVTAVGIPIGLIILAAYLIGIYLSPIPVGYLIGRGLIKNSNRQTAMVAGVLIIEALKLLTPLMPLVGMITVFYGFGILINTKIKIFSAIKDRI